MLYEVITMVQKGDLSAGHARALLGNARAVELAQEIVSKGLNVRQTERLAKAPAAPAAPRPPKNKDADCVALERDLTTLLGLKVSIDVHGTGGKLSIQYQNVITSYSIHYTKLYDACARRACRGGCPPMFHVKHSRNEAWTP